MSQQTQAVVRSPSSGSSRHDELSKQNNTESKRFYTVLVRARRCTKSLKFSGFLMLLRSGYESPTSPTSMSLSGAHGREARERRAVVQHRGGDDDLEWGGVRAVADLEERELAVARLAARQDPAPDDHALAHEGVPRVEDGAHAGAGDRWLEVIHGELARCRDSGGGGAGKKGWSFCGEVRARTGLQQRSIRQLADQSPHVHTTRRVGRVCLV